MYMYMMMMMMIMGRNGLHTGLLERAKMSLSALTCNVCFFCNMSFLLNRFIANSSFVSFFFTSITSPNAPFPITFNILKS